MDGRFLFDSLSMSDNLKRDPHVEVHLESGDEVVIIQGLARRLRDPEQRRRFAAAYRRKYAEDPPRWNWSIKPTTAFAWTLEDFGPSATRWSFERDA